MVHNHTIMRTNWEVIKADYLLHQDLSLRDLAAKYDVALSDLGEVCSREQWVEERKLRGARIVGKAMALAEEDQVERLRRFNSAGLRLSVMFLQKVDILMAECRKSHELRSLAVTVETMVRTGRLCLGAAIETTQVIPPAFDVESSREQLFNRMLAAQEEDVASPGDDPPLQ